MEISKKQSDIIQLMRGVAVIMVVLQHSIARIAATNWQFKIIYFLNHIDVAIFFVISGYLFEFKKEKYYQESKMVYIKNKIKALLFPYLFWSLILAVGIKIANIFMPNLQNIIGIKAWTWKDIIINTLFFKDYNVQHLWFIYVLFFFFLLNRLFRDSLINGKVFVFIILVSIIFNHIKLNYILDKFVLHFANFLVGRLIVKHNLLNFFSNKRVNKLIPCVLITCVVSEIMVKTSFTYTYLGNSLYALSGVYCVYIFAKFLASDRNNLKIEQILQKIGDYSFEIYLMHNPYISILVPLVLKKLIPSPAIIVIITTILGIIIPCYIANVLFYYSNITVVMFGKKGKKNETRLFDYCSQ